MKPALIALALLFAVISFALVPSQVQVQASSALQQITTTPTRTLAGSMTATLTRTGASSPTLAQTPAATLTLTGTSSPTVAQTMTATPTRTGTSSPTLAPTPTPTPAPKGTGPADAIIPTGETLRLDPQAAHWYRFEYGGDRTPFTISVDNGGATEQEFALYMRDQVDAMFRGDPVSPLGRGAANPGQTGHDLFWTGTTNRSGTYFVVITNHSNSVVAYRLMVTGSAVVTIRVITPTPTPVPNAFENIVPINISETSSEFPVYFPIDYGKPPVMIRIPPRPATCTPPESVPTVITQSLVLCPDAVYSNLHLVGNLIGLFGDSKRSARVVGAGRTFAITAEGDHLLIHGVEVWTSTAPEDKGKWLCAFGLCSYEFNGKFWTVPGGPAYGGGILLKGNETVVSSVAVKGGGTTGIALMGGTGNMVINSHFDRMTGWGAYSDKTDSSYFLGNSFNNVNRDCVSPDGIYYSSGCETAGWLCVGCQNTIVAENQCAMSGNCYYASGDGGQPSVGTKFYGNYCWGSPNNCFEVTFSQGNEFDHNVAARDPISGDNCNFPFWIGGSSVRFGRNNNWGCVVTAQKAIDLSRASTSVPTEINK